MKLIDQIQLAVVELDDFKIHCATGNNLTARESVFSIVSRLCGTDDFNITFC
jgi:hypothetical protein